MIQMPGSRGVSLPKELMRFDMLSRMSVVNGIVNASTKLQGMVAQDTAKIFCVVVGMLISTLHLDVFYYSHDTPKWFVFDIATSLYVIYSLKNKQQLQYSYLGALCVALIYLMVASLWIAAHKVAGLEFTLRFVNATLFAYCLFQNYSKDRLVELLLNAIFWSAFVFSLLFITERYILFVNFNAGSFSPAGYINNAGALFNLWIPGLVLFIYQNRRQKARLVLAVFSLLVVVSILMEAATRGTIIGLSVSELIVFVMVLRKNLKQSLMFLSISTLLLLGIGLYQVSDSLQQGLLAAKIETMKDGVAEATGGRMDMFRNTMDMAIDNPWGVGINNFEYIHPKYGKPGTEQASPFINEHQILRTPHNIVLKLYSELGYLGGTLFLLFLVYFFIAAFVNAWRGGYVDKWLFVGVSATLFHTMLSAVLLTPASLFFSCLLFVVINARFVDRFKPKRDFAIRLPIPLKALYLLIPVLATTAVASEYYGYQGRVNFDGEALEKAIALNPGNDRALLNLSQVRFHRHKDIQGSLEALNRFLELYPYHIFALMLKAERHYQLNDLAGAQHTLSKLLGFYPNYQKAQRLKQIVEIKIKQISNGNDIK
jgi:O-antigen ligase